MGFLKRFYDICLSPKKQRLAEEAFGIDVDHIDASSSSGITDEDLLTYSLLTGNKEMEKAMLWKIWSK